MAPHLGYPTETRSPRVSSAILTRSGVDRLRFEESRSTWTAKLEELGYEEDGDFADFDQWYDDSTDYHPLAEVLLEETMLQHRPS